MARNCPKIAKIQWILAIFGKIFNKNCFTGQKSGNFQQKWTFWGEQRACAEGKSGLLKNTYARVACSMCKKQP